MPEPVIYHIDVNSAFLSWEAAFRLRMDPSSEDLRKVPSIIAGDPKSRHGIVLASSIPAKKMGVVTAEPIASALKKCPDALLIAPNYHLYAENSRLLMEHLRKYAPTVDQFSIDEAFCDMTGTELLYGNLIDFAYKLKNEIYQSYGFTVNIGISTNYLLAKMASDFEKPNKVHTLFPDEIQEKMWPLPVENLLFVGKSTAASLHRLGIHTIKDLATSSPQLLSSHLKKQGQTAWQYANGICDDTHFTREATNKGYSHSTTLSKDCTDPALAKEILLSLCETVGARLREDKMKISVVSVTIKNTDFESHSKQTSLYSHTDVTDEIYTTACKLFDSLYDGSPIRLLCVSTSKATDDSNYQYDLFHSEQHEKLEKLDSAIDEVRSKFGQDSIQRATFLKKK